MLGKPKFKKSQVVKFVSEGRILSGTIFIVDRYGTFEQHAEPSYDILCKSPDMLYKHIRESFVLGPDTQV